MYRDQGGYLWYFKSLEISLQRDGYLVNGVLASDQDNARLANAFTLLGLLLVDVGVAVELPRTYSTANVTRWLRRLRCYDVISIAGGLKTYLQLLRRTASWLYRPFKSLKASLKGLDVPEPLRFLDALMYRFFKTGTPFCFYCVNTVLQFVSRLTLFDCQELEDEFVDGYLTSEKEMRCWEYDPALCAELNRSFLDLFGELTMTPEDFNMFSNGATAEVARGKGVARKMSAPITVGAMSLLLRHEASDFGDLVCDVYAHSHGRLAGIDANRATPLVPNSTCKVKLVPKGIAEKRVISMEPSWSNFVQSGIFRACDRYFESHPKSGIHLHNQEFNRLLAQQGSQRRNYSTLDLHAASDSVTVTLVKEMCKGSAILPYLIRSRSAYADLSEYGRGRITLEKFAPMGSMCCFPLEAMTFSAIIHIVELRHSVSFRYLVYGDDLVVPTEFAQEVIDLLAQLHFVVNEEKSFVGTLFTESCGTEAYKGFDVSPARLSRRYDVVKLRSGKSPESYVGAMDLINTLWSHCYFKKTRRYLLKTLLEVYPETYFCHPGGEYGIWCESPSNSHLVSRVTDFKHRLIQRPDYQVPEYRCIAPSTRTSKGNEELRYLNYLWRASRTRRSSLSWPEDRLDIRVGQTQSCLKTVWLSGSPDMGLHAILMALRHIG